MSNRIALELDARNITTADLRVAGRYHLKAFVIPEGETGRQEFEGPMVPGPWADTFGLATVLSATPIDRDPVVDVADGDVLILGGNAYTVEVYRREYIRLTLIEGAKS